MRKTKRYDLTRFSADVISEAAAVLRELKVLGKGESETLSMTVEVPEGEWQHETEAEFFADYRDSIGDATYTVHREKYSLSLHAYDDGDTDVSVQAPERPSIERVFAVFEKHHNDSLIPDPRPAAARPAIFIGHGRSPMWRDLKDHLHEKHGLEVQAYEIGARAGHTIRDILEDMLRKSSFAILVMTAEDKTKKGQLRARQNVVHEAGLFQGRLGFHRAVVLLEKGTEEFSNIHGLEQIRFSKGNIKEAFGEILAVVRREFPGNFT